MLSKQYALARMRSERPRVVVFSMGKTGSTAIAGAVRDATGERVFQVFRLRADGLAAAERRYRESDRDAKRHGRAGGPAPFAGALHLWESEYLLRHPPTPERPWTVVSTVREPVAQAVSAFFHGALRRGALERASGTEEVVSSIVDDGWIRAPVRFFDREFAPALGVDVFASPFEPARGTGLIETPSARVLLLRQESMERAPEALGDALRRAGLLRRSGPVLVPPRNEAATRDYAAPYRRFLAEVRFPSDVVDEAYASRYARHFYAPEELDRLRRRWISGPEPAEHEKG